MAKMSKAEKKAAKDARVQYQSVSGTGMDLLSSVSLNEKKKSSGIFGGGAFINRGPALQRDFLLGEMSPTGFLSSYQTSLEGAGEIRDIFSQSRNEYSSVLNGLGASGLSRRYALPIANQALTEGGRRADEALVAGMGQTNRNRYMAMQEWINSLAQSVWAGKMARKNYQIGKKGAQAAGAAGMWQGAGGISQGLGSLIGGSGDSSSGFSIDASSETATNSTS